MKSDIDKSTGLTDGFLKPLKDTLLFSFKYAPEPFVGALVSAILTSLVVPFSVLVNRNIFYGGVSVFRGEMTFSEYSPFLVLLVISYLFPSLKTALEPLRLPAELWFLTAEELLKKVDIVSCRRGIESTRRCTPYRLNGM